MRRKRNFKSPGSTGVMTTFSILFLSQCKKEGLKLASEQKSISLVPMPDDTRLAAAGIISCNYYLVNSLPSGFVREGSNDDTTYIQAAVNKYSNVVFPGFPIQVYDAGINIGSNKTTYIYRTEGSNTLEK